MNDFWAQFDKSYRLFSQFCDSDDWHRILKAVAGAVAQYAGNPDSQISILDVGCGSGVATQTICEMVYSASGCFPTLVTVEPSVMARSRLETNILQDSDCGPLRHNIAQLDALPADLRVDAILFLHSTYYIDDLSNALENLVKSHLRPTGAVCALVLPENSPFFMDLPCLPNCSDALEAMFKRLGLEVSSFTLKSRFLFPEGGEFSDAEYDALRRFWMPSARNLQDFKMRVKEYHAQSEIDFQDHLLVGKSVAK